MELVSSSLELRWGWGQPSHLSSELGRVGPGEDTGVIYQKEEGAGQGK